MNTTDSFETVDAYIGCAGEDHRVLTGDPAFAALSGSSRTAVQRMQEQFLPLASVAVGDSAVWFAFYDPGANWFPSALWTIISLIGFAISLVWLDRIEQREKRLARWSSSSPRTWPSRSRSEPARVRASAHRPDGRACPVGLCGSTRL